MPFDRKIQNACRTARIGWIITSAKLRMFTQEMEECLQSRLDAIRSEGSRTLDELRAAPAPIPISWDELDDVLKVDGLPPMMRNAVFLTVFGVFEHHVAGLCGRIAESGAVAGSGPSGTHLWNSQAYLSETVGIPLAAFGTDWQFVDDARVIRNYLAHDAASISPDDVSTVAERARKFVECTTNIQMVGNVVRLDAAFLKDLLESMDGVFNTFWDQIQSN